MIPALITIAVLCIVFFWPVHLIVKYREDKAQIYATVLGVIRLTFYETGKQKKKKKPKKTEEESKPKEKTTDKALPEKLDQAASIFRIVMRTLDQFCKHFSLYRCKVYALAAGEDPATVAIEFGAANAIIYSLVSFLEEKIRIRKKDIRIFYDYNKERPFFDLDFRFSVSLLKFVIVAICVNWRDLISLVGSSPSK